MAQWRKVIVSGSDAILNHISASGNIVADGNISASGNIYLGNSGSATDKGIYFGDTTTDGVEAYIRSSNNPGSELEIGSDN